MGADDRVPSRGPSWSRLTPGDTILRKQYDLASAILAARAEVRYGTPTPDAQAAYARLRALYAKNKASWERLKAGFGNAI